ncbi:hypothetical protein LSH36_852g02015 [Paralvinella palmiformis]|uniref:Uncharacterized protein n=1 Tax=Paralvinella palmiformis TaxID=53620 RepID=A0AAD9IZM9_9ANNE|nr:hypothetical protein LSH36_852g02015 [Paralvinella palmiformis]
MSQLDGFVEAMRDAFGQANPGLNNVGFEIELRNVNSTIRDADGNGLTEVHFCVIPPYNSQIDPEELLDPDDDQVKKGLAVVHMSPYMAESSSGPEVKNTDMITAVTVVCVLASSIIVLLTVLLVVRRNRLVHHAYNNRGTRANVT